MGKEKRDRQSGRKRNLLATQVIEVLNESLGDLEFDSIIERRLGDRLTSLEGLVRMIDEKHRGLNNPKLEAIFNRYGYTIKVLQPHEGG